MKTPLTGFSDWARELCRALGEDPKMVRNIRLDIPVDGVVTVSIEKFISVKRGGDLINVIKLAEWSEDG